MSYSLGNIPIWEHFSIPDIFADPYIDSQSREKERKQPPFHCLALSIQLMTEFLSRLM